MKQLGLMSCRFMSLVKVLVLVLISTMRGDLLTIPCDSRTGPWMWASFVIVLVCWARFLTIVVLSLVMFLVPSIVLWFVPKSGELLSIRIVVAVVLSVLLFSVTIVRLVPRVCLRLVCRLVLRVVSALVCGTAFVLLRIVSMTCGLVVVMVGVRMTSKVRTWATMGILLPM